MTSTSPRTGATVTSETRSQLRGPTGGPPDIDMGEN